MTYCVYLMENSIRFQLILGSCSQVSLVLSILVYFNPEKE
jgi:hypothetical protein